LMIASNGQLSMQMPHFVHVSAEITCGSRRLPEIAPAGQLFAHKVQPLQRSAITSY